nr:hypothetical protein [Oscillospiraceae bacterium]
MRKILLLFVIIVTVLALLCSCELVDKAGEFFGSITGGNGTSGGNGITDDNGDTNDDGNKTAAVIWSQDVTPTLVFEEEMEDVTSLFHHIYQVIGVAPKMSKLPAEEVENEIIIGDVGRQISDTAYLKLDRFADFYSLEAEGNSAYLIYAEGGNLSIAYSDIFSRYAAIDWLIANAADDTFAADGVVARQEFDTQDFIAGYRNAGREESFAMIEKTFGTETTDAVRMLCNLFDYRLYVLLANLYDPGVGGFYYSSSARNTKRYLPDVESTGQALGIIEKLGLSAEAEEIVVGDDTYRYPNFLPDEMISELYSFVSGLKAHNGYYYHSQWGTSINTTRLESDKAWGEYLVSILGKGIGVDAEEAASAVIADIVQTEENDAERTTLINYLEKNLSVDSYTVSENLKANFDAIKSYGLVSDVVEYLNANLLSNGLYENRSNFKTINALANFIGMFGDALVFTDGAATVNSAISTIYYKEDSPSSIYDIYNCWVVIDTILSGLTEEDAAALKAAIREQTVDLLQATFDKLSVFKNVDGGFSTNVEKSGQYYKEMLVAVEAANESDINATYMAVVTVFDYLLPILGIDTPEIFFGFDADYFLQSVENLEDVIKETSVSKVKPIISDVRVYDFESGDLVSNSNNILVNNSLADVVSRIESDSTTERYEGCFLSIITDPNDASNKLLQTVVNDGLNSSLTLYPYYKDDDGLILVFEFDYCYIAEGNFNWGGIDHFDINFADDTVVSEQAIYKPTLYDTDGDGKLEVSVRGGNISGDAGVALNVPGGTWIKIRAVIDEVTHKLDIYMSTDGGESWFFCLNKSKQLNESSVISMTLRFTATLATKRVEYFDNISFERMNYITFNSNVGYKNYGVVPVDTLE